jgi:hypothetical protein
MEYMLNELSLNHVQTKMQVYGLMENFVHAAVYAEQKLGLTNLCIDISLGKNLFDLSFLSDYSIGAWLGDSKVSRDIKDKFLIIISSSPLITDCKLEKRFQEENCYFNNTLGKGLKAALICKTLCVNFLTEECWNTNKLSVIHEYIEDDDIIKCEKQICCFGNKVHVESHLDWLRKRKFEELKDGKSLWEGKSDFFPNLIFCSSVKQNLSRLGKSIDLANITRRLQVLDEVAMEWESGSFSYELVNNTKSIVIHPESQMTLDNFSAVRCFLLPNGERTVFSLHVICGNLRMHFYPDNQTKKIYVGYIGPHLRTWLY